MSSIEWKEALATLSVKQTQQHYLFFKKYFFLLMFSIKVDTDEDVENLAPYLDSETFLPNIEISSKLPSIQELVYGSSDKPKEEEKKEKKIRGRLMIVHNTEVSKTIYDKYSEDQKITVYYDSKNPKRIRVE